MDLESDESDDEVLNEINVYLSKNLADQIYILQYPIRPSDRPYDDSKYIGARIKPQEKKLEIEMELNTFNENYSKPKGEQFSINVDGRAVNRLPVVGKNPTKEAPKYYRSNMMDKTVFTSSDGALGQMNKLYHLGCLKENGLHLTPVKSMLQMKPSFEYFDIYEKKIKDAKLLQGDTDCSTEEDDGDSEKAELVTLKYSSAYASQVKQEPEQNWIPVRFLNVNDTESECARRSLYCTKKETELKIPFSKEEFIQKLINPSDSSTNNDNSLN